MSQDSGKQILPINIGSRRTLSVLLLFAVVTGFAVSLFSLIEELCMATACSDAASFTFFGIGMAWLGIAYFGFILVLLWLRNKSGWFHWILAATVFSGVGAELRLLWIQKYIIGSWCPLCVTICCALFFTAILLVIEKFQGERGEWAMKGVWWLVCAMIMVAAGLAIALIGVQALT